MGYRRKCCQWNVFRWYWIKNFCPFRRRVFENLTAHEKFSLWNFSLKILSPRPQEGVTSLNSNMKCTSNENQWSIQPVKVDQRLINIYDTSRLILKDLFYIKEFTSQRRFILDGQKKGKYEFAKTTSISLMFNHLYLGTLQFSTRTPGSNNSN